VMYAREPGRFVAAGGGVCKVAGKQAFRSGKLLGE
jgi:hypothetical protein